MKFKSDIEVQAGLKDSSGSAGTSGQILSSTASGVSWINQISLSGYVPYTGATTNVDLGTHTLLANDLVINHSSGSGVAASITKGGNGEALTINKTSGSGNAMSVTGGLTSLVDLTLSSIANATTDTDKFIVSDSGLIKYRTGAQVLSDIGGQPTLSGTGVVKSTAGTISYINGTTAQYIRGDGSLATFPTIPSTPTLDEVLNEGNTSLLSANVGELGLWDSVNSNYITLSTTDQGVTFNVPSVGEIFVAQNDGIAFGDGALASIKNDLLTASRVFQLPNTSGTLALTSDISGFISGSGTTNYVPKFTSGSAIGNSLIYDNGTNVGIGTTSPGVKLVTVTGTNSSGPTLGSGTVGSQALLASNGLYGMYSGVSNSGDVWHQVQRNDTNTSVYNLLLQPAGGDVAIGTTAPLLPGVGRANVTINGASQAVLTLGVGGSWSSYFYTDVTNTYIGSGGGIVFSPNGGIDKVWITTSGYVGIGTSVPTALLTVAGDALINGVTVGRGAGNDASNTVVGRDAFVNNLSGQQNTVIGYSAGANLTSGGSNVFIGQSAGINVNSGVGNTIIGTLNSFPPTGAPADFSDTLSISKGESNYGTFLPHIWAPATMFTNSTETVILVAATAYRAMFVEYVIEDESGNIRGGYIKAIWNNDLSVIKMTEDTTSSIGVTSNYTFNVIDAGSSNIALQITSAIGDWIHCSVTSRLLTRPY